MPTTFRPYQPDQGLLLPSDLRDWLPAGHLAHHVSDLVDGLDLKAFYARYEGDGRRKSPYEPRMMAKVLIYGYATGVFSSRGLARKLEEDVAFRVLAAGNFPSHRTLCEFRRRHLSDFKKLFVEVVGLAREMGVANFGRLSVDGTKVRANASKRKAMSYARMLEEERRLKGEIEALVSRARETDAAEDARFGEAFRGDELPEELSRREDRLAAIRAAKARLEARQREADDARGRRPGSKRNPKGGRPYKREYGEPQDKAQDNFTDPESRIMKTFSEILHCPKPVIHRVNGDVVGGANAFHLAADFVVMNRTAKFQQVGVGVGSVAAFGPTQWWPLMVGDRRARDILMALKPVPAELAAEWGVANVVCDYDELDAEVDKIVANLARMFPDALRYTKVALNHQKEMMFREMTQAREWCTLHFPSMESRSGFGAFFHKKPIDSNPSWEVHDTGHNTVAPYGGYSLHCDACGADHLPEDHKFCGVCGAGLTPAPAPAKVKA